MQARLAIVGLLAAITTAAPAFAYDGPGGPYNQVQGNPAQNYQGFGPQGAGPGCVQRTRPQLTPEQRAQRRAMRQQRMAERAARGLPPVAPHPHQRQGAPRC